MVCERSGRGEVMRPSIDARQAREKERKAAAAERKAKAAETAKAAAAQEVQRAAAEAEAIAKRYEALWGLLFWCCLPLGSSSLNQEKTHSEDVANEALSCCYESIQCL